MTCQKFPNSDSMIVGTGSKVLAITTERHALDHPRMAFECPYHLTCLSIPNLHRIVSRTARNQMSVWAKINATHPIGVTIQDPNDIPTYSIPDTHCPIM